MEEQETLRPLPGLQIRELDEALTRYEAALGEDVEAARYLLGRGMSEAVAATHRLGVVRDPLAEHLRYEGWLAIPYLGHDGLPVQIRFRCMKDHDHGAYYHGKYMTLDGDPARVYGVQSIHAADDEIHVTEGELDRIVLTMLGFHAVAIPGASGFQSHHRRMLAGFSRVYVWGDPDEAGAAFAGKITRMMSQAVSVRLPMDVNDTYLHLGEQAIFDAFFDVSNRKENANE